MTLKALPIMPPIHIEVDKYFKKRDLHGGRDHDELISDVKGNSIKNIEVNF